MPCRAPFYTRVIDSCNYPSYSLGTQGTGSRHGQQVAELLLPQGHIQLFTPLAADETQGEPSTQVTRWEVPDGGRTLASLHTVGLSHRKREGQRPAALLEQVGSPRRVMQAQHLSGSTLEQRTAAWESAAWPVGTGTRSMRGFLPSLAMAGITNRAQMRPRNPNTCWSRSPRPRRPGMGPVCRPSEPSAVP